MRKITCEALSNRGALNGLTDLGPIIALDMEESAVLALCRIAIHKSADRAVVGGVAVLAKPFAFPLTHLVMRDVVNDHPHLRIAWGKKRKIAMTLTFQLLVLGGIDGKKSLSAITIEGFDVDAQAGNFDVSPLDGSSISKMEHMLLRRADLLRHHPRLIVFKGC